MLISDNYLWGYLQAKKGFRFSQPESFLMKTFNSRCFFWLMHVNITAKNTIKFQIIDLVSVNPHNHQTLPVLLWWRNLNPSINIWRKTGEKATWSVPVENKNIYYKYSSFALSLQLTLAWCVPSQNVSNERKVFLLKHTSLFRLKNQFGWSTNVTSSWLSFLIPLFVFLIQLTISYFLYEKVISKAATWRWKYQTWSKSCCTGSWSTWTLMEELGV